ncbi:alpha/beta hydrolase [Candidatus Woesearchaeota archaeon]|nr:alpha/beta hydrolase [Candidatus Woesearchaeota archaeon]
MAKIVVIHGTKSDPDSNWFPWLKDELKKVGHEVIVPRFPTPKDQNLQNWMNVISGSNLKDCILIGHSLGAAFILSIVEEIEISQAFLISGFLGDIGIYEYDKLNSTFTHKEFDWIKIKENCHTFHVINSDNDPYVPWEKGEELAERLSVPLTVIKNGGHINTESGYVKFDLLLDMLIDSL